MAGVLYLYSNSLFAPTPPRAHAKCGGIVLAGLLRSPWHMTTIVHTFVYIQSVICWRTVILCEHVAKQMFTIVVHCVNKKSTALYMRTCIMLLQDLPTPLAVSAFACHCTMTETSPGCTWLRVWDPTLQSWCSTRLDFCPRRVLHTITLDAQKITTHKVQVCQIQFCVVNRLILLTL